MARPPTMLMSRMTRPAMASPRTNLRGAVHGPVELALPGDLASAPAGLVLVDQAGVEVGVDRHLLARHGVQGEAGGHLGDAAGALGDDHEVDDHQDAEDDEADDVVAAHHEVAEGLDDPPGGMRPLVAVQQDQAGGGDVERQPEEGGDEEQRGEDAEVELAHGVERHEQDDDARRQVEGEQDIEQEGGQRQDHDRQNGEHPAGQGHIRPLVGPCPTQRPACRFNHGSTPHLAPAGARRRLSR